MQSFIQKWDNDHAIRLPKAILDISQLSENEPVQIFAEQDKIIIKKLLKHKTLKERLEGFKGEYVFEEWDTGVSVGREGL